MNGPTGNLTGYLDPEPDHGNDQVGPADEGPSPSASPSAAVVRAGRLLLILAACVAAASLVVVAWGQYEQMRLTGQQTCILKAEGYMTLDQSQTYPPDQVRLARCLGEHVDVAVPDIVVPNLVSLQLSDALKLLETVGLRGSVASGDPACDQSTVVGQQPGPRGGVRPLTVVVVRTSGPPGVTCRG